MGLKAQVIAINQLLSDIYQRDMRLSYLLSQLNFDGVEIELISQRLLPNLIEIFLDILEQEIHNFSDGERQFEIIKDIYGITSDRLKTLRQVGAELNISHERIRQIKNKGIRKLGFKNIKADWESKFKREVKQLLENYNDCGILEIRTRDYSPKYNFSLSRSSTGEKCLIISEGDNSITIDESCLPEFYNDLQRNIQLLKRDRSQASKIEDIRIEYPRAYDKWTKEEEEWLSNYLIEGLDIKQISKLLERQSGAISSRMNKLGLS